MRIEIPEFSSKIQLFDFLYENKSLHLKAKKSEKKEADGINVCLADYQNKHSLIEVKGEMLKASDLLNEEELLVKSIINTTNFLDSHDDVHIDGIWKKALKDRSKRLLIQEHVISFKNLISDSVKGFANFYTWQQLGYKFDGSTQALEYHSIVSKLENEYMHGRYAKQQVKNHSVGMQYVKLFLAVNNDTTEYKDEFETFHKYIDRIVNKDKAMSQGFFWAVKEAIDHEGSAVVKGSNILTPTTSVEPKSEPPESTHKTEPSSDTQKMNNIKFITLNN